jgi:serine/threonine protein kinase
MNSSIRSKDAINFLALVREDLASIKASQEAESTVVTGQYRHVEVSPIPKAEYFETAEELDEMPPSVLGRFKIIEQIGEGGFARVFLANDPNLDRDVALKLPKPHALLSSDSRARFEREAKSAAILSHPNIVPVFESGAFGPIHFIASEYCAGPTLRKWLTGAGKQSNPRMAVEIVCRLADALQHAHHRGIIHRDLKPANIILADGDKDLASRLRITDFGLARQVLDHDSLTANGAIIGTPAYMSPEQAEGIVVVDHRTDIYSLGMILYELLMGTAPFKRKNHAASIAAVINESVPSIRDANPKIDRDLESICLKSLQKDPELRYPSAHDFGQDLERWLQGREVSVRKLSRPETFQRWLKRNRLLAVAVSLAIFSLTAGFLVSASQWKQAQTNLVLSNQQRQRAEKNADELHGTIVKALEISVDSLEKDIQVSSSQQKVLDELMLAHKRLIDEEAEVQVSSETFDCYQRLARIYRGTGRLAEAFAVCDQSEKMIERCFETEGGKKRFALSASKMQMERGLAAVDSGQRGLMRESYDKSIKLFEAAETGSDRQQWLKAGFKLYRNVAFSHFSDRETEESVAAFGLAAQCANEALELSPDSVLAKYYVAKSLCDISHTTLRGDNWQSGLEMLEEAELRFMEIAADPESEIDCRYRLCYIRNEIGFYLRSKVKDYDRAEEYIRMAMDGLRELIKERPGMLRYTNRLSHAYLRLIDVYRDQGMHDEVLTLVPESIDAHRAGYKRWSDQRTAYSLLRAGVIWNDEYGDSEKAIAAFDEAIEMLEESDTFALDFEPLVDTLLAAYRQKSIFYDGQKNRGKATGAAGDGYRLAVQRALRFPSERNLKFARSRAIFFAKRMSSDGEFGHAKAVLDTLAEAGSSSMKTQYDVAHFWAKLDHMQREEGRDKEVWMVSRAKALNHLANAIELGFSDYELLRNGKYFSEYQHLPEFEANCDRIEP